MNTATLRAILRLRLLDVPDLPPVQGEGKSYHRANVTYLEDEFRGGATFTQSNGTTATRSLYLLTIHTAPARITADMDRVTDALLNAFEPGRTLVDTARTHQVEIRTVDSGAQRVMSDAWGYRRVTVSLFAIAFRTQLLTA